MNNKDNNTNVAAWDTDYMSNSTSSFSTSTDRFLNSNTADVISSSSYEVQQHHQQQDNTSQNTNPYNSSPYQYVKPSISLADYTQQGSVESHPISKPAKFIIMALLLIVPAVIYIVAIKSFGDAFSFPFFMVVIPSVGIFTPLIYLAYRKNGHRPHIRRHPVLTLVTVAFAFFSFLVPVYLTCLLSPLYNRSNVSDNKSESHHPASWLIALPIAYLQTCVFLQITFLSQCSMRSMMYRTFVSLPASVFFTTIVLSIPFMLFVPLLPPTGTLILMLVPFILAVIGLYQTLITRPPNKWEVKNIMVRKSFEMEGDQLLSKRKVQRVRHSVPDSFEVVDFKQPLSIVQIADPHLGPIMSIERLEEICESTVKLNPDLVLLTGDFFTLESFNPPDALDRALAPLKKLSGKTFACIGNHDLEEGCLDLVKKACQSIGCCLLIDNCVLADTRIGKVQILGFDYRAKSRQEHVQMVCDAFPAIPNVPRIGLLHDPGAFKFVPNEYGMLVFSGHTHGGQIGLNCLGINLSVVSLAKVPDHSLWQNGYNYLYVHSGQGCRSLMGTMILRVGVPAEDSLLQVYFEN